MIVVVEPNSRSREFIVDQLDGAGKVFEAQDITHLAQLIAADDGRIEVVLLGPGILKEDALAGAERVQSAAPEVSVIFLTAEMSNEFLHAALRAGVKDVLADGFGASELNDAVTRGAGIARSLRVRSTPAVSSNGHKGFVVTVFSGKGGCGKSFVSTNLAVLLAETGKKVALVDLDLQSGDLGIMLQLNPQWTLLDVAAKHEGLDLEELTGYLTDHSSGVRLLAAPYEPQDAEHITGDAVHSVLGLLREAFDYVVVDGPSGFTDPLIAAIDESDECILMTSMDVPSIKNLKISLRTVAQLGVDRSRLRIVLNRADSKVGLHLREVEESIQTPIDVALPSSRDVPLSINHGVPLAMHNRKSRVVAPLMKLAEVIKSAPVGSAHSLVLDEVVTR